MFTKTILGGIAGAGLLLAVPVAPVLASDSSDGVETKGTCSASAYWEMKVEEHDGGVAVQFEVKSGGAGSTWDYSLSGPDGVFAQGSKVANSRGKVEVETTTSGAVSDTFTATATSGDQVCDSTVGVVADSRDSEDSQDDADSQDGRDEQNGEDQGDDDVYDGSCSADSAVAMVVTKVGKNRIAKLSVDGARKGEKWRYTIRRGNKVVHQGVARTKGKKATLKVTKKTRGKGHLRATATRVGGREDCSVDDDVTNDDVNDDSNDTNDD